VTAFTRYGLAAIGLGLGSQAMACSVCIAHAMGAAFHAIGAQTMPKGTTVVGVSYSAFSKSQDGEMANTRESHRQSEFDFEVMHSLSDSLTLRASVPYVFKTLEMTGEESVRTRGIGDATVGLRFQVHPGLNDKALFALTGDFKLPTGANGLSDGQGNRLEEHSQVGTGSRDFSLGAEMTSPAQGGLAFASVRYRFNGTNADDYHYGDTWFYNLGYVRHLDPSSDLVLELNGRVAKMDSDGGVSDENSGGHFGYFSASYRKTLGDNFGVVCTYQIPVIKRLNGTQTESGLLTIGIFKRV
jgi:hypothetical protein